MTEVSFHFNAPSRVGYACRLLRKAQRQGTAVAVTGPAEVLAELDRELWTFAPAEFVPHAWVEAAASVPERLRGSTVWLAARPLEAPVHQALLNLGPDAPAGFASFERLVEVVTAEESDRETARTRWKDYARRGYAISRHEVGA